MNTIPGQERLEQVIGELEAYETPVTSEQCDQAIALVVAVTTILRGAVERKILAQESSSGKIHARLSVEMVACHYAIEQADHARSHLAAFKPLSKSSGERARRKRQIAVYHLRNFARAVAEVRQEGAPPPRPRPDYLRLVGPEEGMSE